jgi:drug/metabolite transporter (DMT)-like permease
VATGIAFAAGDIATKATVEGDLLLAAAMVACYGAGTILLQMGFQRGGAVVTAGLATLLTNAIPIAAGMTIFHEPLPDGAFGAIRILAFATVVVSAVFLASRKGGNQPLRERDEQAKNEGPSHQDPDEAVSTEIAA